MIDDRVLNRRAGARHLVIRLGQFLQVVVTRDHRVDVALHASLLEHLEDDGRILRIVLVPGVEHCLSIAGLGYRRDADDLHTGECQPMGHGAVIVASGFETRTSSTT